VRFKILKEQKDLYMDNMTYSQAITRLEEIMATIQGGGMDIDRLAVALKEASELVKFCRGKLYKVDEEVKAMLDEIATDVQE
jgi:exodeoxyribonuclease VII small subunit